MIVPMFTSGLPFGRFLKNSQNRDPIDELPIYWDDDVE